MKKKGFALFLAVCMTLTLLPGAAAAEEQAAQVVFESSVPNSAGYFQVTMTMYDVTFRVYQFALRYDPAVVQPVDREGNAAVDFDAFAVKEPAWISTVGTQLNSETGLIDFTGYIMPGTTGALLDDTSQAVVGADGLKVYTFYFKQLQAGDSALQVATEDKGEPYCPACPQGVIIGAANGVIPVTVTFRLDEAVGAGGSEEFTDSPAEHPSTHQPHAKTVDELLEQAVFLEIGSHAAVVEGGVTAIYPGERSVTAYAHDNRTFVPVRFVAEQLGADVDWENDTQTVVVEKDGHTVRMAVGSLTYALDGVEKTLDVPAEFAASTGGNSRTMVPVRFVTEALGYQVEWEQAGNLVVIAPQSVEWDPDGSVEGQAMDQVRSLLTMYGSFV